MNKKNLVITALYQIANPSAALPVLKILGTEAKHVVAWDFPARNYKKAFFTIRDFLAKHNIQIKPTIADWPHFSIAYIPPPDKEQQEKIKLAGPLFSTRIRTDELVILKGDSTPYIYLCWHLAVESETKVKKLIDFLNELTDTTQKFEFNPHVSIAVSDPKNYDTIEKLLPQLEEIIKPYHTSYLPEQLHLWDKMTIYDIESMKLK
jgi:hypothetical protein